MKTTDRMAAYLEELREIDAQMKELGPLFGLVVSGDATGIEVSVRCREPKKDVVLVDNEPMGYAASALGSWRDAMSHYLGTPLSRPDDGTKATKYFSVPEEVASFFIVKFMEGLKSRRAEILTALSACNA